MLSAVRDATDSEIGEQGIKKNVEGSSHVPV